MSDLLRIGKLNTSFLANKVKAPVNDNNINQKQNLWLGGKNTDNIDGVSFSSKATNPISNSTKTTQTIGNQQNETSEGIANVLKEYNSILKAGGSASNPFKPISANNFTTNQSKEEPSFSTMSAEEIQEFIDGLKEGNYLSSSNLSSLLSNTNLANEDLMKNLLEKADEALAHYKETDAQEAKKLEPLRDELDKRLNDDDDWEKTLEKIKNSQTDDDEQIPQSQSQQPQGAGGGQPSGGCGGEKAEEKKPEGQECPSCPQQTNGDSEVDSLKERAENAPSDVKNEVNNLADSATNKQDEAKNLRNEATDNQKAAKDAGEKAKQADNEVKQADKEIGDKTKKLNDINSKIPAKQQEVSGLETQLVQANSEVQAAQAEVDSASDENKAAAQAKLDAAKSKKTEIENKLQQAKQDLQKLQQERDKAAQELKDATKDKQAAELSKDKWEGVENALNNTADQQNGEAQNLESEADIELEAANLLLSMQGL